MMRLALGVLWGGACIPRSLRLLLIPFSLVCKNSWITAISCDPADRQRGPRAKVRPELEHISFSVGTEFGTDDDPPGLRKRDSKT
ncbi:hypothetical protein HDV64DRAFT_257456 [Trichoderma sp. TUCIM 5745]